MTRLQVVESQIHQLICKRRQTFDESKLSKINKKLTKLYELKYELLKGE